jgi:hypothetical protein
MADIDRLNTTGFLFTSTEIGYDAILRADFGQGLQDAVTIGDGLRTWMMKMDVLPDSDRYGLIKDTQLTRAAYVWKFYCASKLNNDAPFWFRKADPGEDERDWLVSFTDDKLTFTQLCDRIHSAGLTLKQRTLRDQEAPGDATPVTNPDEI